jgi:hypothetical protein
VIFVVFKILAGDNVCTCPFTCCLSSAIDDQLEKKDDLELSNVIIFLRVFVSGCSYFVLPIVF